MRILHNSSVWRCGVTSRYFQQRPETTKIMVDHHKQKHEIHVVFEMASKGGGNTHVEPHIGAEDFSNVIAEMAEADPAATTAAIAIRLDQLAENQALPSMARITLAAIATMLAHLAETDLADLAEAAPSMADA